MKHLFLKYYFKYYSKLNKCKVRIFLSHHHYLNLKYFIKKYKFLSLLVIQS